MSQVRVAHLQRHPVGGNHSVERIFEDVRAHLPAGIDVAVHINQFPSAGVKGRLKDALAARRIDTDVRHITGDVHYLGWFLPRAGTLLTILDCVTIERLTGWRREAFKALWYRWPIARAQRLTTISTFSAESIERHTGYPAARIDIIPPPLSDEFVRAPQTFNSERTRVLQVGTTANKNIARVIAALAGLPVELVLVGELAQEQREALAASGLAYENLIGISRAELLEQYRRADIVMFASLYEGFGMPIIEAQAIGRPVITSDRCSMPEAAGGGALLIDPEDTGAIRSAVKQVIGSAERRAELLELGAANAKKYRPARIAERYANIYRELA